MYDATLGRFLQRDPLGLAGRSVNLYQYVAGRPTRDGDPSGMDAELKAEDLMANLKKCDGDTDMHAKAKKANNGRDPSITVGDPRNEFGASVNLNTGAITISKKSDKCEATATLFFELTNLWQKEAFDKVDDAAGKGQLGQEAFVEANEQLEYESVRWTLRAIRRCKEAWGCKEHKFCLEPAAQARNFTEYYRKYLQEAHKDYYRKIWKDAYEAAFNKQNPPKN